MWHKLRHLALVGVLIFCVYAPGQSRAAITFVDTTSSAPNSTSSTFVVAAPATIQVGDLMIGQVVAIGGTGVTVTPPPGWTLIVRTNSTSALLQGLYYKFAVASDFGASFTWTLSSSQKISGGIVAYRGVNTYEPINVFAGQANGASTNVTAPSVTTTASNAMLVGFFGLATAQATFTPPAGMTKRFEVSSNALPGTSASATDVVQAAPGASGTKIAIANKFAVNIGQMVALRPAATLLADYHFDECAYTGVGAEVIDSTGSYNASAKNGLNTATPGVVQRYGNFNTYATYAQTSIPIPGEWAVSVWFTLPLISAQQYHVLGSVAGGSDLLYLDANNGLQWGVYTLSATTPGTFKFNTLSAGWHYMTLVGRGNDTLLYIDGSLVDTIVGNKTKGTLTYLGTSYDNVNTALAQGFGAPLDEMRVYLNPLTPTEISTIYTNQLAGKNADGSTRAPVSCGPDHLIIQSSGSGLTCAANTLTVVACQDVACATPYTNGVTGTLSVSGPPPTVNWDGTTGGAIGSGFVIPIGSSSVTKSVQVATAGTATFGVASATPTPINPTTCNFGTNAPSNNNCVFTANTAGFIFSNSATGNTYTIPSQISGIAATGLYLRAVQASTTNPAICTPAIISSTTSVNMGYTCNNPTVCQPGSLTTINATAIAPGGTAVSLTFDVNGSAPITVRYDDVGQITLNANKTVTPFVGAAAITLNGNSNAFIVKPYAFTVTAIQRTADGFANPAAASAAGTAFIKAGDSFTATVTATNFSGAATPNFGKETTPEGVLLTPTVVLPVGGNNSSLSNGSLAGGLFSSGTATVTNLSWGEVGIITLTPSIASTSYLGAGNVTGTTTGNIGRFYPHHFVAIATLTPRADLACPSSSFTYMGEPMTLALTLTAQNAANFMTQNYTTASGFAKLDGATASKWTTFGANDSIGLGAVDSTLPTALSPRLSISGTPSGVWTAGAGGALAANVVLNRNASVDGSFDNFKLGIAPQDADGVILLPGALNLDADLNGSNERQQVATGKVRYGRLRLNNAHGSELLALPVPLTAQYFNGAGFVTNTADNCTAFTLAPASGTAVSYQYGNLLIDNPQQSMTATASVPTLASNPLSAGVSGINLSAPSLSGSIDLTLTVPAWLQFNWTGVVGNPKARATFGAYRNTNQFIYQRENY